MDNTLEQILACSHKNIAKRKQQTSLDELKLRIAKRGRPKDLSSCLAGKDIKLIAEIKRASPRKGILSPRLNIVNLARSYVRGGASAISVLTETDFFHGSFADMELVRETTDSPILCKDFIDDDYQVYEACAYGADAILLIAAILPLQRMSSLLALAHQLGISALVEVHNEDDLEKALAAEANIIGINNRNLADLTIDLTITDRLRPLIPSSKVVVSESGIQTAKDVAHLRKLEVNAILIGEVLVTSSNPAAKIKELLSLN